MLGLEVIGLVSSPGEFKGTQSTHVSRTMEACPHGVHAEENNK